MCACTVEVVRKVQQTISLTGSARWALRSTRPAPGANGVLPAVGWDGGAGLRSSSPAARPRPHHLLQLKNVHLPWEVEVVCIGHWLGVGHQHFTTRCVLDARRGGARRVPGRLGNHSFEQ